VQYASYPGNDAVTRRQNYEIHSLQMIISKDVYQNKAVGLNLKSAVTEN
jgi:hypothetical protein